MTTTPLTEDEKAALVAVATAVRLRAEAPYSRFLVGAALLAEDGSVHPGCNVESASYGLTICAERNAVFRAIADGKRGFRAVAVVIDGETSLPCGACRQVLWDQCGDIEVILAPLRGTTETVRLSALLPRAFELGADR